MKTLENLMSLKSQTIKKCFVVIAAATFASLASVAVFAEVGDSAKKGGDAAPKHKHHGDMDGKFGGAMDHGKDHMIAKLDLTDAQKETMKAARAANEDAMKALHDELRAAHDALGKAVNANADDAMLNKLATDLASVVAKKEVAQAKARRDFINLLTPEQKQKLAALKAEHENAPRRKNKAELNDHSEPKTK